MDLLWSYLWVKSMYIFIIKGFRTIVFIFIVISTNFRPICPPVFFILWPHQEDVQILLDYVNSIRKFIQFTLEKKQDNKLPFLDVLITRTEQGFRSSVYPKPTFTGQYLNFNSHHPYTVKKGIVRCSQHRSKTISSDNDKNHQASSQKLRQLIPSIGQIDLLWSHLWFKWFCLDPISGSNVSLRIP